VYPGATQTLPVGTIRHAYRSMLCLSLMLCARVPAVGRAGLSQA
jgi:hypothetical protein